MTVQALDVSSYQPRDLSALIATHQPQHIIVKLYQAIESVSQDHSREQLLSALANGCSVGGYVWGYANTDPRATVQDVVGLAQSVGVALPVLWLDIETYMGFSGPDPCWIREAVEECRCLGIRPGIYTARWYWDQYMIGVTAFSDLPLWLAEYDDDPDIESVVLFGGWQRAAAKQWSNTPVDQNTIRVEYTQVEEPPMPTPDSEIEALKARVAVLEALLDPSNGNLTTPGNITSSDDADPRPPTSPLKWLLGCLYFFSQNRPPGQGTERWAGLETYKAPHSGDPSHAAWGYGGEPGRLWFMNTLMESNGDWVGRNMVISRLYFQQPKHRDLTTGLFVLPHHYDAAGVPYADAGETNRLGGIQVDSDNLGVSLSAEDVVKLKTLLSS